MPLSTLRPSTGHVLAVTAALVWSLTSPGLKFLLDRYSAPPLALAFWRDAFIAIACIVTLLIVQPALLRISRRELYGFALAGAISIGLYHALWIWSIALNGAAVAVVLIYTFPTFVTLGSWLLFHEPLRPPQLAALALSLIGCALLVRAYDPAVFQVSWLGALVGLVTGLTHSVYVLFSQRAVQSRSPWTSLTYTMLFGSLVLLVLMVIAANWGAGSETPAAQAGSPYSVGEGWLPWLVLLGLALGPTLGGYSIFTAALRHIPGRVASLIVVLEAPISTLLAVWLIGERLEWLQVAGIGLILGSIGLPSLLERIMQNREWSIAPVAKP